MQFHQSLHWLLARGLVLMIERIQYHSPCQILGNGRRTNKSQINAL